jgi:hypothetical protein
MAVTPGPILFHDPGRQPGWRVIEPIGQGLGLGALDVGIAPFGLQPGFPLVQQRLFSRGQRPAARPQVRRGPSYRGGVNADEVMGIRKPQIISNARAPVAPLSTKALVTEPLGHQLGPQVSDLQDVHATLRGVI